MPTYVATGIAAFLLAKLVHHTIGPRYGENVELVISGAAVALLMVFVRRIRFDPSA